jgi:hypothetical protein
MAHPNIDRTPGPDVLRRRHPIALLVSAAVLLIAGPAQSAGPVVCPPDLQSCIVTVDAPGTGGQSAGPVVPVSAGNRTCVIDRTGVVVPCVVDQWGWFNNLDDCYYRLRDPQPPASEIVWEGHYPQGAVYNVTCVDPLGAPGTSGGWTWLASAPDGYGATGITAGELAARAVDAMQLRGASVGVAPPPGAEGLVGVPVWMWTDVTPTTWGPNSATATVPGLSVTATAQASKIVWDMGDGTKVTCANPGTKYFAGGVASPSCGYVYKRSSADQPNDAYTVTATTTWVVTWTGGGTTGSLTVTRASTTTIRIGELQVLVTG